MAGSQWGGIPGSWIPVACFFVPVWVVFLQEASVLHFGVCTAAFQLLGVVGSHVRKISEDVVVGLVTWGKSRERQRRERHPQALGSSAAATGSMMQL